MDLTEPGAESGAPAAPGLAEPATEESAHETLGLTEAVARQSERETRHPAAEVCALHPHAVATLHCHQCDRLVCSVCAGDPRVTCPACRIEVGRKRLLIAAFAAALGVLMLVGWYVMRPPPPEDLTTVADAREAVARTPADPVLRVRLGELAQQAGLPAEAETSLKEALRLAPDHLQAHRQLAALYFEADRRTEARAHIYAVLAGVPNDGAALLMLGQLDRIAADDQAWRLPLADLGVPPADASLPPPADAAPDAQAADAAPAPDMSAALLAEQVRADEAEGYADELGRILAATQADLARVQGRLDAVTNREVPAGFCAIPLWPRPGGFVVSATVNRNPVNLVYDPLTPLTALTRAAAERLQVRPLDGIARLAGPSGMVEFQRAQVRAFSLGTRKVADLPVVLCAACVVGADGILGADLVRAFNLQAQPNLGRLLIAGCP